MADDAAGAVRRTPRPACDCEMFDFCDKCWGPEQQREAQIRQLAYCEEIIPSGPEDAEQCPNPREPGSIHCATHQRAPLPEVMHDAGETADEAVRRLAAEVAGLRQNQRPVVLLRAEDCSCPVGGDCPHGPEPVDALDLAAWLHAEQQWMLGSLLALAIRHRDSLARRCARHFAAEQQLQARIDAALKLIVKALEFGPFLDPDETRAVLAALQGDQPTEPETRCMNGPAKQHTLHMVGIIKALKSAAGMDHLPLEPPRRDNFARLARAIADHWPREIARPSSEPTGEADRG